MSFDRFLILLQGASSSWWQHLHNQHHSKPNVVSLLLALVYTDRRQLFNVEWHVYGIVI